MLKKPVEDALKCALEFTHHWMNREVERIQNSETETDQSKAEVSLGNYLSEKSETPFAKWNQLEWDTVKQQWKQAFKECGIMEKGTGNGDYKDSEHRRIELWRAATDVREYVCCVPSRRYAIRLLRRELISFNTDMRRPRRSRSLMAVASPGSGKTHFVKQLAKSHKLAFVHFNITQMLSKADILDCFDTIVSREAQDNEPLLVFFDEINARINGQHVYDMFLAPIEENVYVRGGKTFRLPACVWLFAGTEDPSQDPDVSSKGCDFVSRLSLHPIRFRPEPGEEADVNTEHVYLGVTLLKLTFPDITKVSEKVLRAFEFLRPDVDVRQVKHLVNSFLEVEHEQVLSRNVPVEYYRRLTPPNPSHRHHFDRWWELDEGGDMVTIEVESPGIRERCD